MRWVWLAVVCVVCSDVGGLAVQARAEASNHSPDLIRIREERPTRVASQSSVHILSRGDTSPKSAQHKATARQHDLLPRDILDKLGVADKPEPLHVEPWVPGKGAVGVRVELTW